MRVSSLCYYGNILKTHRYVFQTKLSNQTFSANGNIVSTKAKNYQQTAACHLRLNMETYAVKNVKKNAF